MTPMASLPNPETVEVFLDTTWRLAAAEEARTDGLDRKATSLAAFASLVVSISLALASSVARVGVIGTLMLFLGLALMCGAAAAAVRALIPEQHVSLGMAYVRRFPTRLELTKPADQVRGETLLGLTRAIAREREVNSRKAKTVRLGLFLLLGGLALLVGEALILGTREVL
jgi:hypothetical protein